LFCFCIILLVNRGSLVYINYVPYSVGLSLRAVCLQVPEQFKRSDLIFYLRQTKATEVPYCYDGHWECPEKSEACRGYYNGRV
jgi:hypothetical protein